MCEYQAYVVENVVTIEVFLIYIAAVAELCIKTSIFKCF